MNHWSLGSESRVFEVEHTYVEIVAQDKVWPIEKTVR
jgi:hypothetical protein